MSGADTTAAGRGSRAGVAALIERLSISLWHVNIWIIGVCDRLLAPSTLSLSRSSCGSWRPARTPNGPEVVLTDLFEIQRARALEDATA
jgi:hypothetical protein